MANYSERLKQNSKTEVFRPTVKIISSTEYPVGTIFSLWYGSRHSDTVSPSDIERLYKAKRGMMLDSHLNDVVNKICKAYPEHNMNMIDEHGHSRDGVQNVIHKIVKQVIEADLPPTESVLFNIEISNANVAWREQLVRSKFATYWTQTSRTQDLSTMDVNMSDSIKILGGDKAVSIYQNTVEYIREAYRQLHALGVPMEDIRLQPQGHTHRVYWMINLRSLIKIINKRADWIAQASLWTPIIAGVCSELRRLGLMDLLQDFVGKPFPKVGYDTDAEKYYVSEHAQTTENEDRYYGRDPLPCDPLWLSYTNREMPEGTNIEFYDYLKSMFIQIWGDEYLAVLGWDRNQPSKVGPYDRPSSYWYGKNL